MEAHTRKDDGWMHRVEDDYHFLMQRARSHLAGGCCEQARDDYSRAASLSPQSAPPHVGLGIVALYTHDLQEAETAFETACRLDAACAKGMCGLAIVHHRRGLLQQAAHTYHRCLEIDGDNLTALLGLLDVSARNGGFEEVRYFLQQYLTRHPDDVAVMLCLAAVHLNEDRVDAAKDILFDILIVDPRNATASALMEELDHMRINQELERARRMYLMQSW